MNKDFGRGLYNFGCLLGICSGENNALLRHKPHIQCSLDLSCLSVVSFGAIDEVHNCRRDQWKRWQSFALLHARVQKKKSPDVYVGSKL